MKIFFVSGFLGSGKTTTIINTSKILIEQGLKIGVVTNDQGRYLVDNHFVKSFGIPSVEVTNGCFCCNYDNFDSHITNLADSEKPDIIFAESVGSCADIIATVMKPFMEFRSRYAEASCLSAFTDARMLKARLSEKALPFSDNVTYIFDKQIEESDILIINKSDLLSEAEGESLLKTAALKYPEKRILLQSAFTEADLIKWINFSENLSVFNHDKPSMKMNYEKYSDGELKLAWFDKVFSLESEKEVQSEAFFEIINSIAKQLREESIPLGHLKIYLETSAMDKVKFSLTSMDIATKESGLPPLLGKKINMVLNARVESNPAKVHALISSVLKNVTQKYNLKITETDENSFQPGKPSPVHRFA